MKIKTLKVFRRIPTRNFTASVLTFTVGETPKNLKDLHFDPERGYFSILFDNGRVLCVGKENAEFWEPAKKKIAPIASVKKAAEVSPFE